MTARIPPDGYTPAPGEFDGRVVMVTGATGGIGRAVAVALAECGAMPVLLGRDADRLGELSDAIVEAGHPAPMLHAMDFAVAAWPDYLALAHALAGAYGRLDGLLHAAAVLGERSPILHYDAADWQRVMTVNLTAPFLLTRACLGLLGQSQGASVLFTGSGVGKAGAANWGAYSVSKFGLEGLAQVLADEMAEHTHIRVNALNPGAVRTAMRRTAFPAEDPGTLPSPESVAPAFLYLLGPAGRGIRGRSFDL